MADPNQQVFNLANEVLSEAVVETAGRSVDDFRRELQAFLSDYMGRFYPQMFKQLDEVYRSIYPSAGEYYRIQKLMLGGDPEKFYGLTGDLQRYLLARDPNEDFGNPKVKFTARGERLSDLVYIDRGGRPQYRAGSGRRGFAPYSVAFSRLVFSLEVDMFSKIRGRSFQQIFNIYEDPEQRMKFAVGEFGRRKAGNHTQAQPPRPLLRPFINWYGTTNLRNSVQERFGIRM